MKQLGLIGYPLEHSFSKKYFTEKFNREGITDWNYNLFPLENITDLKPLILNPNIVGLNVTIPYKEAVLPYLNSLDETAKAIGAVNTIKINRTDKKIILTGYNTDCIGFEQSLLPLLKPHHKTALVLGTGGASKAVMYVLHKLGLEYKTVSSSGKGDLSYNDLTEDIIASHHLIINTTPLGMHPSVGDKPNIPYAILTGKHLLYDLVYNPLETAFLAEGKRYGATIKNGLEMLELQADAAWDIFNVKE